MIEWIILRYVVAAMTTVGRSICVLCAGGCFVMDFYTHMMDNIIIWMIV